MISFSGSHSSLISHSRDMVSPIQLLSFNRLYLLCILAFFSTSVAGILSCHLSFIRQLKWKWLSLLTCVRYTVQVSRVNKRIRSTTALKTFSLVSSLTVLRHVHATLAFAVLAVTSSAVCTALENALPRQVNLSTTCSFSIHSHGWLLYGFPGAGWYTTSVFFCANRKVKVVTCLLNSIDSPLHFCLCFRMLCKVICIEKLIQYICLQQVKFGLQPP